MSIIHIRQISAQLENLYSSILDISDIKGTEEEKHIHFLSRALAGYSIQYLCTTTPEDTVRYIVDDFDDNGIDAIYYSKPDRELYVIQSKWNQNGNGSVQQADTMKLVTGFKDLLNFSFDRFSNKLNKHKEMLMTAIKDSETRFHIVLAHTGTSKLSKHSQILIDDLLSEMNDPSEVLQFSEINQGRIHQSIVVSTSGSPINTSITLTEWGTLRYPHISYYGQVSALEIWELWQMYRNRLFDNNLRNILGSTDVNNEIAHTISTSPELFWYFNNGVTMIANKVKKTHAGGANRDFGVFDCTGINIVNGAQTVGCIGQVIENNKGFLEKTIVPMRIISLENSPDDFGRNITKTNNRQNKIENRDFVSLDPEQGRIKAELRIDGITYHIMRSAETSKSEKSFDIVESTTALAVVSGDIKLVVQRKREISKMWEDLNKPPYKLLFNNGVAGRFVWQAVQLNRRIENAISKRASIQAGREQAVLVHGNFVIAFMLVNQIGSEKIRHIDFVNESISDEWINEHMTCYAKKLHNEIDLKYGATSVIPTLFKNPSKCIALYKAIDKEGLGSGLVF